MFVIVWFDFPMVCQKKHLLYRGRDQSMHDENDEYDGYDEHKEYEEGDNN